MLAHRSQVSSTVGRNRMSVGKNELLCVLAEVQHLLQACGVYDEASRIETIANRIKKAPLKSDALRAQIRSAKLFMNPRGTFCDRGMAPLSGSRLSAGDVSKKQDELCIAFWHLLEKRPTTGSTGRRR